VTHSEQSFPEPSRQDGVLASRASELEGMRHSGTKLSIRERMIVILMSSGLSNKEIARHLYISPRPSSRTRKHLLQADGPQPRAGRLSGDGARLHLIVTARTVHRVIKSMPASDGPASSCCAASASRRTRDSTRS